jgi:hypothetical protein
MEKKFQTFAVVVGMLVVVLVVDVFKVVALANSLMADNIKKVDDGRRKIKKNMQDNGRMKFIGFSRLHDGNGCSLGGECSLE